MKKNRYLLFLLFFVLFLVCSGSFVHALEIKDYPSLPGVEAPSADCTTNCLPKFVVYIFGLLIYVAGAVSLISFTIGAIGLINPNPEAHGDAKDRMKGSVFGLVLTLTSFIILNTINPVLTNPTINPLPPLPGVYYVNNNGEQQPCPAENPDTSGAIKAGLTRIKYTCTDNKGPNLLVWLFPDKNFGPIASATIFRVPCGNPPMGIGGGSFKVAIETPGIYYCMGGCSGNECSGYMSGAVTSSQDKIEAPFRGNIQSVRIVNDPTNNIYYGAIFHGATGLKSGGQCGKPLANEGNDSRCFAVSKNTASAVDIFRLNKTPATSGDGVSFYSDTFGPNAGSRGGYDDIPNKYVKINSPFSQIYPGTMLFDYTNIAREPEYIAKYPTFQSKPGSINIKGSYLVGLYSNGSSYCQTFNGNQVVADLNAQPFIASGGQLDTVYIIPTQ